MPRPRKVQTQPLQAEPLMSPVSGISTGAAPPTHDQWEYRTLKSADGDEWDTPFTTVGHNGWELVTIYAIWDAHTAPRYRAVFKRRVNSG